MSKPIEPREPSTDNRPFLIVFRIVTPAFLKDGAPCAKVLMMDLSNEPMALMICGMAFARPDASDVITLTPCCTILGKLLVK